LKKLRL